MRSGDAGVPAHVPPGAGRGTGDGVAHFSVRWRLRAWVLQLLLAPAAVAAVAAAGAGDAALPKRPPEGAGGAAPPKRPPPGAAAAAAGDVGVPAHVPPGAGRGTGDGVAHFSVRWRLRAGVLQLLLAPAAVAAVAAAAAAAAAGDVGVPAHVPPGAGRGTGEGQETWVLPWPSCLGRSRSHSATSYPHASTTLFFAPALRSSSAISAWPHMTASISGVRPSKLTASTEALRSRSVLTAS